MNYLSISSIVRNESLYLREWVEFHIKQGVEHFYLYDNSAPGEPDQKEVVSDYTNLITWHDLPGVAKQREACDHTIVTYRNDTELCAFIDVDEFLFSPLDASFKDAIKPFFTDDTITGLAVHWLLFGSSGQEKYSSRPVVQRFTRRSVYVNTHVKSVMRLKDTVCMGSNVHTFRANGHIIDETYKIQPEEYALGEMGTAYIVAIAHYVTKSREECALRRKMPRADTGELRSDDFFEAHDCNDIEDLKVWKKMTL